MSDGGGNNVGRDYSGGGGGKGGGGGGGRSLADAFSGGGKGGGGKGGGKGGGGKGGGQYAYRRPDAPERVAASATRTVDYPRYRIRCCVMGADALSVILVTPDQATCLAWKAAMEPLLGADGASIVGLCGDHTCSDGVYHNFLIGFADDKVIENHRALCTQILPKWRAACPVAADQKKAVKGEFIKL
jgi:hypothetical protein